MYPISSSSSSTLFLDSDERLGVVLVSSIDEECMGTSMAAKTKIMCTIEKIEFLLLIMFRRK